MQSFCAVNCLPPFSIFVLFEGSIVRDFAGIILASYVGVRLDLEVPTPVHIVNCILSHIIHGYLEV